MEAAQNPNDGTAQIDDMIRAQFRDSGSIQEAITDLGVTVEQWRSRARAVARSLRRPVKTFVAADQVFAVLTDWPIDDGERERHQRNVRAAFDAISNIPFD